MKYGGDCLWKSLALAESLIFSLVFIIFYLDNAAHAAGKERPHNKPVEEVAKEDDGRGNLGVVDEEDNPIVIKYQLKK